jgi:beta-1,4-mannosyl-glycoprotein beta-1,4-N-acetylglucosaminyltransferase
MVIDVFPFFNEYELLKLRMEALKGVVDMHLAVVGDHTYQGEERSFNLDDFISEQNPDDQYDLWAMYARVGGSYASAWDREKHLRQQVRDCVKHFASDGDIIIYTDADELPNKRAVWDYIIKDTCPSCTPPPSTPGVHALQMRTFYYGTQWEDPNPTDRGKIFRWADAKDRDWDELRWDSPRWGSSTPVIRSAGWHISYFGGADAIERKLRSFSHVEYSTDRHIQRIQLGHRRGRGPNDEILVPVDASTLPEWLRGLS